MYICTFLDFSNQKTRQFYFSRFIMLSYSYYNGEFDMTENIRIPLSDRSIYFGDGIYDAAIGHDGRIFLLDEHVQRFLKNAKKLQFQCIPTYSEISEILQDVVMRANIEEFFLYFQISRNAAERNHSAANAKTSNILITVSEARILQAEKPISLITEEDRRYFMCDIKTVNLLPSVIASTKAELAGCEEAVFHRGSTVTECAHSNIAILKKGVLYTHPLSNTILPGITRQHLLSACEKLDITYRERAFTLDELYFADEILVTSTSKLCRCANRINNISVGGKDPINASKLSEFLYKEYINL